MKCKYSMILTIMALTVFLFSPTLGFAMILGTAENFAVLGGSTVTNTGSSIIDGNLGISPGTAATGFPPGTVNGTINAGDAAAGLAKTDAGAAYLGLLNMPVTNDLTGQDLGGLTLTSGVYYFDSSAELTGLLVLNAQNLDNAFWVFQIGSTLTTASASSVSLINTGSDNGVYWQVGTSATLGTATSFIGNILADESITMTTGSKILCGRALALTGSVTMDTNEISAICGAGANQGLSGGLQFDENGKVVQTPLNSASVPEPATLALLGLGLLGLRFKKNKCGLEG